MTKPIDTTDLYNSHAIDWERLRETMKEALEQVPEPPKAVVKCRRCSKAWLTDGPKFCPACKFNFWFIDSNSEWLTGPEYEPEQPTRDQNG